MQDFHINIKNNLNKLEFDAIFKPGGFEGVFPLTKV